MPRLEDDMETVWKGRWAKRQPASRSDAHASELLLTGAAAMARDFDIDNSGRRIAPEYDEDGDEIRDPYDRNRRYSDWNGALLPFEVLLGYYVYEYYHGEAFVLMRDRTTGALYRVDATHCSCYGLEGKWDPTETSIAALRQALSFGEFGRDSYGYNAATNEYEESLNLFADELSAILDSLEA